MPKLTDSQIMTRLPSAPGWMRHGDTIVRTWQLTSASRAIDFVNRVTELAQRADHYPEIGLRFRSVRIELSTHAEGGLTEADFALAEAIDQLTPADRPTALKD